MESHSQIIDFELIIIRISFICHSKIFSLFSYVPTYLTFIKIFMLILYMYIFCILIMLGMLYIPSFGMIYILDKTMIVL